MSNRIDDKSEQVSFERGMDDRRKDALNKDKQRQFESKIVKQRATNQTLEKSTQQKLAGHAKSVLDDSETDGKLPFSKAPKETKTVKPAPTKEPPKKTDKEETAQTQKKEVRLEEKRSDLATQVAVKRKKEQQHDQGFDESDAFFQQAAAIGMGSVLPQAQEPQSASGTGLSPEVIGQMVDQIYLGINAGGLKQMTIELKSGELKGGQISVATTNGKVFLSFRGLDSRSEMLVKNSRQSLREGLSRHNLNLAELTFE